MITTLHGLVTIFELFGGFNRCELSSNCLQSVCQNARKMHNSETKKSKNFLGRGQPPRHWGGDTVKM